MMSSMRARRFTGPSGALLVAIGLAADLGAAQETAAQPEFEVSQGPFERTWALIDPLSKASAPRELPLGDLEAPELWRAWAAAIASATAGPPEAAAGARVWLAACAARQGRHDDAWEHLARAGEDPAGLRAVLPLLAPGVSAADFAAWPALPDGSELAPALPPPSAPLDEILLGLGRVRPGEFRVTDFSVGAARIALHLSVEGDGVQIEIAHLSGGSARLRLRVPVPPDFDLGSVHLDWESRELVNGALAVDLEPGSEPRLIYGRYRPRLIEWPTTTPTALSAQIQRDGLCLWAQGESPIEGPRAGLAALLGLPVTVQVGGEQPPQAGVVIDLREASTRAAKLAALSSLAERYALSHRP
jgi:hypothetical protein